MLFVSGLLTHQGLSKNNKPLNQNLLLLTVSVPPKASQWPRNGNVILDCFPEELYKGLLWNCQGQTFQSKNPTRGRTLHHSDCSSVASVDLTVEISWQYTKGMLLNLNSGSFLLVVWYYPARGDFIFVHNMTIWLDSSPDVVNILCSAPSEFYVIFLFVWLLLNSTLITSYLDL